MLSVYEREGAYARAHCQRTALWALFPLSCLLWVLGIELKFCGFGGELIQVPTATTHHLAVVGVSDLK